MEQLTSVERNDHEMYLELWKRNAVLQLGKELKKNMIKEYKRRASEHISFV